jgi:hypothetical protein
MKTLVLGTIASLTLSVALVAAQQQTPPPTQQTPPPTQQQQTPPPTPPAVPTQPPSTPTQTASQKLTDVELTGCLVQGTGPTVFIIENAKTEAQTEAEKGKTYVLVSGAEKIEFTPHLNKKVKITGSVDNTSMTKATPPAGQRVEEKDLPRLTVKSVSHVADTCALMVN